MRLSVLQDVNNDLTIQGIKYHVNQTKVPDDATMPSELLTCSNPWGIVPTKSCRSTKSE
jgi:hypothetical protein